MADKKLKNRTSLLLILLLPGLVFFSCKKDRDKPVPVPEPVLQQDYAGSLVVQSVNEMPPWSETSIGMNLFIDGELGVVSIENGSLEYNGDTILNGNSRIERGGFWNMSPTGILKTYSGINYLDVDARISVMGDVQNVYARDNYGNWVLVNSINVTGTPESRLSFVLQEAIDASAVVNVADQFGSVTWTLSLIEQPRIKNRGR